MPVTKEGICPWCDSRATLYIAMGLVDGRLWIDWICAKCQDIARNLEYNER